MTNPPAPSEPRNPLYLLLLLVSLLFVLTALACVFVPLAEDKAIEHGVTPPPDDFRHALRHHGWKWLLVEVALMIVVGLASMWLDRHRLRALQNSTPQGTIAAGGEKGVGNLLPERPGGCFAQKVPDPFFPAAPDNVATTTTEAPATPHEEPRTTDRGTPPPH